VVNANTRDARGCAAIFVLALVARGLHLFAVAQTPFFYGPVVDAHAYARDAQTLFAHGAIELGFYRPPLYAYLRAGLMGLGLHSPWSLGVLQAIAGAGTAALIMLIARALFIETSLQRAAGRTAGVIAALYGPFIIYDIEQLPSAWVNLLVAIALWLAVRAGGVLAASDAIGGVCLGLATTGWPPALLLVVPVLALRLQRAASPARAGITARPA
jgi:4-amino-4-deoxy-L-arabinose transferase-like glycosyltransferase